LTFYWDSVYFPLVIKCRNSTQGKTMNRATIHALLVCLIVFLLPSVVSASTSHASSTKKFYQRGAEIEVWITAYWSFPKQDKWTARRQCSIPDVKLTEGEHVAADPRIIPYGSKIKLPDGTVREVVDTGKDVKRKKASKGKYIIIDVYFVNKDDADEWLDKYSEKQVVKLL